MMYKRKSFSVEVAEIAEELNLPKATVERVLKTRLSHQLDALRRGEPVTEEGLFTIKPHYNEDTGDYTYRGSVSVALKTALASDDKSLRLLSRVENTV